MPRQPAPLRSPPPGRAQLIDAVKSALRSGQPARARAMLAGPLARDPHDPALLSFAGIAHRALGDLLGALELLQRAVAAAPDLVPTRMALIGTAIDTNRAPIALRALAGLPDDLQSTPSVQLLHATALAAIGREAEAVALLRTAAAATPTSSPIRLRLGHALRALGETEAAAAAYRAVLAEHPADGAAWWSIASLDNERFSPAEVETMTDALAELATGIDDRIRIGFALARHAERVGPPAECFAAYASANSLRHVTSPFNRARFERERSAAAAAFTPSFFTPRRGHGHQSVAPIFIVGMHRSGSTLLEQMLGCHPAIEATAELPHLNQMWRELRRAAQQGGLSVNDYLAGLSAAQARGLGQDYLDRAADHRRTDGPFFIDKMPDNWRHSGLIGLILPEAKIIDLRRHPMAAGWANFRQLYASGVDHSYALEDWAMVYRRYLAFMDRIVVARPGRVHRERFDALLSHPEATLRRIVDFLGVPFDPAMLSFHQSGRAVRTISAEQVRRPLDPAALDAWRRFDPWLDPLRAALGSALDEWDAPPQRNA